MTAQEIADRAVDAGRPLTQERMRKLEKLCQRSHVPFADVLAFEKVQQAMAEYGSANDAA